MQGSQRGQAALREGEEEAAVLPKDEDSSTLIPVHPEAPCPDSAHDASQVTGGLTPGPQHFSPSSLHCHILIPL